MQRFLSILGTFVREPSQNICLLTVPISLCVQPDRCFSHPNRSIAGRSTERAGSEGALRLPFTRWVLSLMGKGAAGTLRAVQCWLAVLPLPPLSAGTSQHHLKCGPGPALNDGA